MWSIAHGSTQSGIALLFAATVTIFGACSEYASPEIQEMKVQLLQFKDERAATARSFAQCDVMDFEGVTRGKKMTCADWLWETNQMKLRNTKFQD